MDNAVVEFIMYAIAAVVGVVSFVLIFAFCVAFYRVYIKKDVKVARLDKDVTADGIDLLRDLYAADPERAMQIIASLPEDQQQKIIQAIKRDNRQWINLDVEKNGDLLYFYDLNESNGKFLFQCKTYEEMLENLEKIRANKGVRISAELVKKLEMEDFFIKPGTKTDEPL